MTAPGSRIADFIPPPVRARLKDLRLTSCRAVGLQGVGLHHSRSRGAGLEFAQYRAYEPGDELFLLGFSRGAFTARSTAGLVRKAGILKHENASRIDQAYKLYRDRLTHPRGVEAQLFRRTYSHETRIRFIGVWDTVGALGIPLGVVPSDVRQAARTLTGGL